MLTLNDILFGALKVLCCPLILLMKHNHQQRQDFREGYLDLTPRPYFLSKSRARTLTLPLPSKSSNRQKTVHQSQCDLLTKLPVEVRQLIWKECLGGMTLHIDIRDRHLRHLICSSPNPRLCQRTCLTWAPPPEGVPKRQLLSVLLSCREVYSEAISHLYCGNIFDTIFPESIAYLPLIILPQRLNAIRSIHLQWSFDQPPRLPPYGKKGPRYDDKMWATVWHNLAQMKGLSELRVEIRVPEGSEYSLSAWTESELEVLQPLREVKIPESFELILPFPSIATDAEIKELPCRIQRSSSV